MEKGKIIPIFNTRWNYPLCHQRLSRTTGNPGWLQVFPSLSAHIPGCRALRAKLLLQETPSPRLAQPLGNLLRQTWLTENSTT